jgi:PAS domain S-box-containing protein
MTLTPSAKPHFYLGLVLMTLAYFVFAHIGSSLSTVGLFAACVWPAAGIALSCLLLTRDFRYAYAIFAGSFLANVSFGGPPLMAIIIAIGSTLEGVVAAYLLFHLPGFTTKLNRISSSVGLALIGAFFATMIGASFGIFALWSFNKIPPGQVFLTWRAWWVGDMTGIMIITPFVLAFQIRTFELRWRPILEGLLLLLCLFVVGVLAFASSVRTQNHFAVAYIVFPLLIWAALRYEQRGSASVSFLTWLTMLPAIATGHGPFLIGSPFQNIFFLQTFLGITAATGSILAAIISERREVGEALLVARNDLADKVTNLSQSRDQLDFILHGISDGIVVTDTSGNFVYLNDAIFKSIGATQSTIDALSMKELIDKLRVRNESGTPVTYEELPVRHALDGEASADTLLSVRTLDNGEERWLMVKSAPVIDNLGRVRLAVSIVKDLTERRRAEESMEFLDHVSRMIKSSVDYEYTLSQIAHLAIRNMSDWCHIDLLEDNRKLRAVAYATHKGEDAEIMTDVFKHRASDPLPNSATAKALRTGECVIIDHFDDKVYRNAFLDEATIEKMRSLNFRSALVIPLISREKILGVMTLMSQTKKYGPVDVAIAEELARRAAIAVDNASLYRDAQKAIQVRDEFLSVASHELKTPITAMKLQMQLRKRSLAKFGPEFLNPARIKQMADEDEKQMDRLVRLVDDMLDISRLQSGRLSLKKELVDLGDLVREVVPRFQAQLQNAGNQIQIVERGHTTGYWDRTRIEQMFINLLTNAIKYGGHKPICIAIRSENAKVSLSVIDNGIGIATEDQQRIFKQFERAHPTSATGLGLGLYIAQKIAHAHGGVIRVESHPGSGSIFTIELPGASSAAPQLNLA